MAKDKHQTTIPSPLDNKTVSMKKAVNGYVVSCYDNKNSRDIVMVAKDVKEAKEYASKMLS